MTGLRLGAVEFAVEESFPQAEIESALGIATTTSRPMMSRRGPQSSSGAVGAEFNLESSINLLWSDSGRSTSQNVFLNLAGRSFWKFFDEGHTVRRLEVSEVGPRKFAQLTLVGALALFKNNKGVRRFAPAFMW